jgi:glucokinase
MQEATMSEPAELAVGLDVGGTKIAGGVVTRAGEVVDRLAPIPTPSTDQHAVVVELCAAVDRLRARHPQVSAIGVGAAGLVDWPEGTIRWAPNNVFLRLPLRRLIAEATGLPTVVDNDANAAAWGEAHHAQKRQMAFITVGTGVGAGLILNGTLYRGRTGLAAEVGHMIVHSAGADRCGCGNTGCLEAVASGTALAKYGREAAAAEPSGAMAHMAGGADRVTGETVFQAALAGDPTARRLFSRVGHWLGVGIATLVNLFDFELIVIGGGLAAAGDLLLDPARTAFQQLVFAREHRHLPEIVPASLGSDAGWIGAAQLAFDLDGEPSEDAAPPDDQNSVLATSR